jgi:hypothetical protein
MEKVIDKRTENHLQSWRAEEIEKLLRLKLDKSQAQNIFDKVANINSCICAIGDVANVLDFIGVCEQNDEPTSLNCGGVKYGLVDTIRILHKEIARSSEDLGKSLGFDVQPYSTIF